MPKKNIIFIASGSLLLLLLIIIPVIISLSTKKQPTGTNTLANPTPVTATVPTKTQSVQTSFLVFQKKSATSSAIILDTGDKAVTAVQLDIAFDPTVIHDVQIQPGSFFNKSLALLNKIDYKTGSIFYVIAMPPTGIAKQGKGEIATIYYSFNSGAFNPTTFQFLARTKVAAEGIDQSVLKSASPISVASE